MWKRFEFMNLKILTIFVKKDQLYKNVNFPRASLKLVWQNTHSPNMPLLKGGIELSDRSPKGNDQIFADKKREFLK